MAAFADSSAHDSFLAAYLVRVLSYTAGMVVVLYIAAGLVKAKGGGKPPLNKGAIPSAPQQNFWKMVWQRLVVAPQSVVPSPTVKTPALPLSEQPIFTTQQTLPLDSSHTAHVLDSSDGRWLLVTGPTGTQLHPLKRASSLDHGSYSSLGHSTAPTIPVIRPPLGAAVAMPDGWGRVSVTAKC